MSIRFSALLCVALVWLLPLDPQRYSCRADSVDFARDVLPILSDKCFVCHGPDSHDESDLRLDSAEFAMADRGGYRAVDPTDPTRSELLIRIESADDPMPPADAEKQLTAAEREVLKRWIAAGGEYAAHWAFVPPRKEQSFSGPSAAIDHYVGRQLDKAGIEFAPEADKHVLARRAALVLTGLPLESDQLDEFLADDADGAYERLVDRLMHSPRFGEHQARYWLDAVRYGDTHGLHLDNRRGVYPYRDWVVRALNENLPFDEFIQWQLAGDLLPDPNLKQLVATGYVRLNPSTGEGGAIADEFQMKNNFDRVETLGTVFLGMSLNCARCHTHKYDPIEQREYYQLLAFFNNTAEPALDGNAYTYGPVVKAPADQAAWKIWEQLTAEAETLLAKAETAVTDFGTAIEFASGRKGWKSSNWKVGGPVPVDPLDPPTDEKTNSWDTAKGLPGTLDKQLTTKHTPAGDQATWVTFDVEVPKRLTLDVVCNGSDQSRVLVAGDDVGVHAFACCDGEVSPKAELQRWLVTIPAGQHRLKIAIAGPLAGDALQLRIADRWQPLADTEDWNALARQQQLAMIADPTGPLAGQWSARAAVIDEQLRRVEAEFTTSLVARELPQPRQTRLLRRGEYDLPVGDPLERGVPAVMRRATA